MHAKPEIKTTIQRQVSVTLTQKDILAALDTFVKGFDEPLEWNDIDWTFDGNPEDGNVNGCKITRVTIESTEE